MHYLCSYRWRRIHKTIAPVSMVRSSRAMFAHTSKAQPEVKTIVYYNHVCWKVRVITIGSMQKVRSCVLRSESCYYRLRAKIGVAPVDSLENATVMWRDFLRHACALFIYKRGNMMCGSVRRDVESTWLFCSLNAVWPSRVYLSAVLVLWESQIAFDVFYLVQLVFMFFGEYEVFWMTRHIFTTWTVGKDTNLEES